MSFLSVHLSYEAITGDVFDIAFPTYFYCILIVHCKYLSCVHEHIHTKRLVGRLHRFL